MFCEYHLRICGTLAGVRRHRWSQFLLWTYTEMHFIRLAIWFWCKSETKRNARFYRSHSFGEFLYTFEYLYCSGVWADDLGASTFDLRLTEKSRRKSELSRRRLLAWFCFRCWLLCQWFFDYKTDFWRSEFAEHIRKSRHFNLEFVQFSSKSSK